MLEFQLVPLMQAWENIALIDQWIAGELNLQQVFRGHTFSFTQQTWDNLSGALNALNDSCLFLGCNTGIAKIQWINQRRASTGWQSWHQLKSDLVELRQLIYTHINTTQVFLLPSDKLTFYNGTGLFDPAVVATCTEAAVDIAEAGKCFALGRRTATVFHLMRIMELGVMRFAQKLSITVNPRDTWGAILNSIDQAINKMPTATPAEREQQTAFQGLRASLHAVKEAWRNPTMHPKATYDEQEAREIFDLVGLLPIFWST
jgi:hypothetical protein